MKYTIITTYEELEENGLVHIIVCTKHSILYGKEFLSVEAAQIAARPFGQNITEKDCNFFIRESEEREYNHEKWQTIKEEKYPGFVGVWSKLFGRMAEII